VTRGLVHNYTGDGKGKTTAALGLVLRACGRGLRCCVVQFMKGRSDSGEAIAISRFLAPAQEIAQFGRAPKPGEQYAWVDPQNILPADREAAEQGLAFAAQALNSGKFDLVVLDEVNLAVAWGILDEERVEALLHSRPESVEVVLTGCQATPGLLRLADLITEMKDVKHPFADGVSGRPGVEF